MKLSCVIIHPNFQFNCLVYSPNVFQVSLFHNWAYGFLLATIIYKGCIGRKLPESIRFFLRRAQILLNNGTLKLGNDHSMKVKSIKDEYIRSGKLKPNSPAQNRYLGKFCVVNFGLLPNPVEKFRAKSNF